MSTATQTDLFHVAPADPNVRWLQDLLDRTRAWMTADEICVASGGGLTDRKVRALAQAAMPLIISGQAEDTTEL